ncbi:MAG: hypothetical protein AB1480_12660 [Nitrospirota bacterium]
MQYILNNYLLIAGRETEEVMERRFLVVLLFVVFACLPVYAWSDCFSDFDCGIGYRCVKAPYKTYGVCMKSVDEFGVQQYDLPRTDSINPRYEGDCDFDTDCPIGFYCHRKYKVCVKR